MMKNMFVAVLAFCFAVSISAEVWKPSSGKGPEVYLDMNMEDLKKQCDLKKKSIRDTRIYAPYLKRYKEIQEEIVKKVKADPKTNIDNLIMEQCLLHPELKKQIANVTDTFQMCLEEKDRLDKGRKDKMTQKVLEIKCADLKKGVIIRSEEKCIKKEPPQCLEMMASVQDVLIPVPVKYTAPVCGEIRKLLQCKNAMKECKEETRKALESFVADEMALVRCPIEA